MMRCLGVSFLVLSTAVLGANGPAHAGTVGQANLVGSPGIEAAHTDPSLINPWGISESPSGPFWVSDNGSGLSTLYDTTGSKLGLTVTVPAAPGSSGPGSPTGQAFNPTTGFAVHSGSSSAPALFLFASEDGVLAGWSPSVSPTSAVIAVDNSAAKAVYKGLALYTDPSGSSYLLAANFRAGVVEVYDSNFKLVRSFRDDLFPNQLGDKIGIPNIAEIAGLQIPSNYAPFNVAVLGGRIFVTYAEQDASKFNEIDGPGLGFVDEVDIEGGVLTRIASHGPLDAPWGLAIAPSSFGLYAGTLLVGSFGSGTIEAFGIDAKLAPQDYGPLYLASGQPLRIPGLWGLIVGNGGSGGLADRIYFAAGPNNENAGLFGSLSYTPNALDRIYASLFPTAP